MLTIVTPPADIVTLAEAKAHLRVTGALDDALISGFIKAATQRWTVATASLAAHSERRHGS